VSSSGPDSVTTIMSSSLTPSPLPRRPTNDSMLNTLPTSTTPSNPRSSHCSRVNSDGYSSHKPVPWARTV